MQESRKTLIYCATLGCISPLTSAQYTFYNSLIFEIFMDDERKTFICYQCRELIPIPADFIGDKYALLEVHYLLKHDIDLRNVNWKTPMTLNRVVNLEIERIKKEIEWDLE